MKIFKKENDSTYTLEFIDKDGHKYIVDPFNSFNEAYEHYIRYFLNKGDWK